ncbi:MAG TPA: FecR domain-containing protein [Bauldia sp.]|nr:FecR domain-containing protein [Bauldia sp.]
MAGRALGYLVAAGVAAAVAGVSLPASAAKIGVTAAVQNQVQGLQGGGSETLAAGSQIFQDEVIATGAKSTAQLLFLDQTTLSVGPQARVTLDKFVYNPSTGSGTAVFNATKGAFRFITGIQAPTHYQIDTAVATIGVRGTIVDGYVGSNGGLYVVAQEGKSDGAVIIKVGDQTYVLKPGQALYISPDKQVTGPMTPDDQFIRIAGVVPFPLYGGMLPGEHEEVDVPDGATVRADDLFDHPNDESCDPCCPGDWGDWPPENSN